MDDMADRLHDAFVPVLRSYGLLGGTPEGSRSEMAGVLAQAALQAMRAHISPLVKQVEGVADLIGSEGFFRASEHLSDVASQINEALKS